LVRASVEERRNVREMGPMKESTSFRCRIIIYTAGSFKLGIVRRCVRKIKKKILLAYACIIYNTMETHLILYSFKL